MRSTFVAVLSLTLAGSAAAAPLKGAGSTAAAPIVAAWAKAYAAKGGAPLEYDAVGSGGGLERLHAGSVQFALSDAWVSVPEMTAKGVVQFPVLVEGIVPIVNIPNVAAGTLKLSGPVLADIYLGKVKSWNAAPIADLNPGVTLPMLPITVVYRADGSGSTFLFTSYLSTVSPAFKQGVGSGTLVKFPVGVAEKGNDGVVTKVKATEGAIGYTDFGRVRKQALVHALLRNRDGQFVSPSAEGIATAAASAPWATAPGFAVLVVDQPGKATWPVTGAVFAVTRRQQPDADGLALLKFFDFAFGEGAQIARDLGYVPLPDAVTRVVRDAWPRLVKNPAGASVWTAAPGM